jgi:integrase
MNYGDVIRHIAPFPRFAGVTVGGFTENLREKGVLTMEERNTLIAAPVGNCRRMAVLLGCLCSIRCGEVRGLQWGDIEGGLITIGGKFLISIEVFRTAKSGIVQAPMRILFYTYILVMTHYKILSY